MVVIVIDSSIVIIGIVIEVSLILSKMKYYTLLLCMFCIFASINAFKGPKSLGNKRIVLKASLSNEKVSSIYHQCYYY